jgi:hypothetical protein
MSNRRFLPDKGSHLLITREKLKDEAYKKGGSMRSQTFKEPLTKANFDRDATVIKDNLIRVKPDSDISGYDIPFGDRGSIRERLARGSFSLHLPTDLYDFVDASRIDLTRRVIANPTLHPFIYNVITNLNYSRTITIQDLLPIGIVFDEVTGSGDSVRMGDFPTGNKDTVQLKIYGAGYTWDLLFSLYNDLFAVERLNDAVIRGYTAKKEDLTIGALISANYGVAGTAKHTAASAVGSDVWEKLYNTVLNAIGDLRKRTDPVTGKKLPVSNIILLTNDYDAWRLDRVINGQLNSPADSKNLEALRNIQAVLGYEGDIINIGEKTETYTGVADNTAYLVIPYTVRPDGFIVPVKRNLTPLTGPGDPLKLEQEKQAWYHSHGVYNTRGITYYVQKITLPT